MYVYVKGYIHGAQMDGEGRKRGVLPLPVTSGLVK